MFDFILLIVVIRDSAMCRRSSIFSSPCFKYNKLILIGGLKVFK